MQHNIPITNKTRKNTCSYFNKKRVALHRGNKTTSLLSINKP